MRIPGRDTAVLVNRGWIYAPDGMTADTRGNIYVAVRDADAPGITVKSLEPMAPHPLGEVKLDETPAVLIGTEAAKRQRDQRAGQAADDAAADHRNEHDERERQRCRMALSPHGKT